MLLLFVVCCLLFVVSTHSGRRKDQTVDSGGEMDQGKPRRKNRKKQDQREFER